jgi:glucuronate isomerase
MGIEERYITGNAPSYEKFEKFAETLMYSPGNPLYHWAHLELQRYFGIHEPLTKNNARDIFDRVNAMLQSNGFTPRDFIKKSNVTIVFTTDDPIDSLEYHDKLAEDKSFDVKVNPAFRPDKIFNTEPSAFSGYLPLLEAAAGIKINSFGKLKTALASRIDYFDKRGTKASDHGLLYIPYAEATDNELEDIFGAVLSGSAITANDSDKYKTALLRFLASEYAKRGWIMELHFGVLRNNNTHMFKLLGPDTGYDSIGDFPCAENLVKLLDSMEINDALPKTMLFPINPKDFYPCATIIGSYMAPGNCSKTQLGTAWWHNDHIDGMTYQIKTLANVGVLGKFTGMLTDSRSFLSYPRHEYFRRIFCNIIGEWVENGEFYLDEADLGKLITDICYTNAINYFSQN